MESHSIPFPVDPSSFNFEQDYENSLKLRREVNITKFKKLKEEIGFLFDSHKLECDAAKGNLVINCLNSHESAYWETWRKVEDVLEFIDLEAVEVRSRFQCSKEYPTAILREVKQIKMEGIQKTL